jgi:hypothetical protein
VKSYLFRILERMPEFFCLNLFHQKTLAPIDLPKEVFQLFFLQIFSEFLVDYPVYLPPVVDKNSLGQDIVKKKLLVNRYCGENNRSLLKKDGPLKGSGMILKNCNDSR